MTSSNMTASDQGRPEPSRAKPDDIHCVPMAHQNSGSHGYEMYPQQFVRLVGCHEVPASTSCTRQDAKLH